MIPSENQAIVDASQWVAEVATGSIATGAATIAVAGIGFAMLAGRVDIRRGGTVIAGCFILFAAPSIAGAFGKWVIDPLSTAASVPQLPG